MGISDKSFLESLERTSRQKEEHFMSQIAERLGRVKGSEPIPHDFQGAPDFWLKHDQSLEERIETFISNFQAVGGDAVHVATMEEAGRYIQETVLALQAKRLVRQDQPQLDSLQLEQKLPDVEMTTWGTMASEELMRKAAEAEIGIAIADYAVSATGSLVLMSSAAQGRTVSLLPAAFIAIIPVSTLKTRLGEVMQEIRNNYSGDMPAGIHFVSGPSRSADIENDLTIGVHGPGIVHAILVDDI